MPLRLNSAQRQAANFEQRFLDGQIVVVAELGVLLASDDRCEVGGVTGVA